LSWKLKAGGCQREEEHMRHTDEDVDRQGHRREPEPPPRRHEQSYEEQVSNVGLDPDEPAMTEEERAALSRPPKRGRT
jgi:hypothetical protein